MRDDELAALDAMQMDEDMARARVNGNMWHFPRVLTAEEDQRITRYLLDRGARAILTWPDKDGNGTAYMPAAGPVYVDGKPI